MDVREGKLWHLCFFIRSPVRAVVFLYGKPAIGCYDTYAFVCFSDGRMGSYAWSPLVPLGSYGFLWLPMPGLLWLTMPGFQWVPMGSLGFLRVHL